MKNTYASQESTVRTRHGTMDWYHIGKRVHQSCIFPPVLFNLYAEFSSVQFSCSVVSNSLQSHGLQQARLPCSSPTPTPCSNSCPLSPWCHLAISSVVPFSSCLQSFPGLGSFPMSQFIASGGQSIGASASRQHIKKQGHYFANKGLSSQGYGFSSSHVWVWELD